MSSVFLCHASEDKPFVEPIQLALTSAGCKVFYDEQSLPPGGDYQARIRTAIDNCDVFVFIASAASIAPGRFTLTELQFVRERWPSPVARVLPVATAGIKPQDLPSYLQAATVLTVRGNTAAEVRSAVEGMLREVRFKRLRRWSIAVALGGAVLLATIAAYRHLVPAEGKIGVAEGNSSPSPPAPVNLASSRNSSSTPVSKPTDRVLGGLELDELLKQLLDANPAISDAAYRELTRESGTFILLSDYKLTQLLQGGRQHMDRKMAIKNTLGFLDAIKWSESRWSTATLREFATLTNELETNNLLPAEQISKLRRDLAHATEQNRSGK